VETSGYAPQDVFRGVADEADLVMMDIKLANPQLHRHYTGVDNGLILSNLRLLKEGDTPFIIRIPLIPGVSDSAQNLRDTAQLLSGARSLQYVELLPYNRLAGAKYGMLGKSYEPDFDTQQSLNIDTKMFRDLGIDTVLL
jgi:pyruvate formate lyase activating enzyme